MHVYYSRVINLVVRVESRKIQKSLAEAVRPAGGAMIASSKVADMYIYIYIYIVRAGC